MAESLGHHFWMDSLLKEQAGMSMAKVMESHAC